MYCLPSLGPTPPSRSLGHPGSPLLVGSFCRLTFCILLYVCIWECQCLAWAKDTTTASCKTGAQREHTKAGKTSTPFSHFAFSSLRVLRIFLHSFQVLWLIWWAKSTRNFESRKHEQTRKQQGVFAVFAFSRLFVNFCAVADFRVFVAVLCSETLLDVNALSFMK